jgi:insertion element IS1 protein InsB
MKIEMTCPTCGSHDISKNGTTRRGKQNYKCRDCNRQFVEDPQWKPKDKDTRSFVNLLLLEKISLAGIVRAARVSESWLQRSSAVILATALGNRRLPYGSQSLGCTDNAPRSTDYWDASAEVIPSKRHVAVDKESGLTSYIERLNNSLKQRISRLERKTLSFSLAKPAVGLEARESYRRDLVVHP